MNPDPDSRVKIQDYFIISFEKLKRGWTLTTSQYTITHKKLWYILELKEQLLKIQKLHIKQTSNLHNVHTHTHTVLWRLNGLICSVLDFSLWNHLPDGRSS